MEKLGINATLLLTQIVNFAIIIFILTKFLYKPVLTMIETRRKKIEKGLKLAEEMEQKKEDLQKKEQEILKKAEIQAKEILKQARADAKKANEAIIVEGRKKIDELNKSADEQLHAKREKVEREMQKFTVDIAENMTKKLVGNLLTEKDHRMLIRKQLAQLEKTYEKST